MAAAAAPELPQALTAAIAAEIERAASRARGEIEGRLVQAQAEAAELAAAGEVLEGERDELAEQVAVLTTERDTLAGKAAQQAPTWPRRSSASSASSRRRVCPAGGGNRPAQDRERSRARERAGRRA
ncbi:hypothetical protein [Klebsiella pneumoniae]|uniref:hypothetical protein n=1 Tax=Klebsiella pneumoniae TaxID=573 RepID=UPI001C8F5229|nr:hypothetical protein [Klebsiella pneumoniae]